jgi:hypothetical protein
MDSLLPNLRYERKFLAPGLTLAEMLAIIRRHPAMFREAYPARVVNNVYLDSPSRRDYFEHIHGAADRVKTRVRWYGPLSGDIAAPALERKIKRGLVSGKSVWRMPALHVNGGFARRELETALDQAGMPGALRSALRHTEPALVNRYRRHYFQSGDARFRLTLDTDLQFFGLRGGAGALTQCPTRTDGVIVELKYSPAQAEHAARVTNALPLRLARCSKYVIGIERLLATQA